MSTENENNFLDSKRNKKITIVTDNQLVIDEGVSTKALVAFDEYAVERHIIYSNILYIRDSYPGIPDIKIINNLLNKTTYFLTGDRVAHNTLIKKGLRSYYFFEGKINDKLLPNIKLTEKREVIYSDKLYDISFIENTVVRNLVLPKDEKQLKSFSTKRRRIRNHFGGFDQLGVISVTVSWEPVNDSYIFGYQIQAASRNGMPAITATENYIVDKTTPELTNFTAICYALILLLRLSLQTLRIKIYFDYKQSQSKEFLGYKHLKAEYQNFFEVLKKEFADIEFFGVNKGYLFLQTQKKLLQLKRDFRFTNELVYENIDNIRIKVLGQSIEN